MGAGFRFPPGGRGLKPYGQAGRKEAAESVRGLKADFSRNGQGTIRPVAGRFCAALPVTPKNSTMWETSA